jgi:transposase
LPEVVPLIYEHRFHQLECDHCGAWTRAWSEEIINGSGYGERVVAHVALLSGLYRQSHRMVQQLLSELFGIEMSVGSINRLRMEACNALSQPVTQAWDYVQAQANVNIDDSSFQLNRLR